MTLRVCSLVFGLYVDWCAESLSFTKEGIPGMTFKWLELCNNDSQTRYEYPDSLKESWNLTYSKSSRYPGGRFSMIIEGTFWPFISIDKFLFDHQIF